METNKASAEELEDAQANDEMDESSEEEFENELEDDESEESEDESNDESEEETAEKEEEVEPSVPLDQFTSTKDTFNRFADKYLDEDVLAELAEEDPKLLARLKREFPKKFKNIKVPNKQISEDDIDSMLDERLEKRDRKTQVDNLRKDLGLTAIEFSDIEDDIVEKADKYFNAEVTDSYEEATRLALKKVNPSLAKELSAKRETKRKVTKMSSGKSATKSKKTEFQKLEDSFDTDMPKGWSAK